MSRRAMRWITATMAAGVLVVAHRSIAAEEPAKPSSAVEGTIIQASGGLVVTSSPPASRVGRDILAQGGNAVDAAVATAFAMAVTWPEAGNIGGGGFMLVHQPGKKPVCIEYRETAPAASRVDMFSGVHAPAGRPPNAFVKDTSRHTVKVVGVPGTVRGLHLAHQRYGKLPWKDLVLPAVKLAEEGFKVDAFLAGSLNRILARVPDDSEFARVFGSKEVPNGSKEATSEAKAATWSAGQRLTQPDLARTLRRIAEHGADEFYLGETAKLLLKEIKAGHGFIAKKDLADYAAKVRPTIHGTYRGYHIYGPPLPSSGGTCLVQMLNMLETFPLRKQGPNSPQTVHQLGEVMRRAFRDRAAHLGDADFVKIPAKLITKEYARKLAATIQPGRATKSKDLAAEIQLAPEGESTTHFSVIDADGLAVSNTYTLEHSYGSRVVVRGAGFLLNNEMGDFNWRPGYTDRQGRIGTPPNQIAPGKRMLSSQTPVIVTKDQRAVIVTGSPGGRTIINTVLRVLVNTLDFKMSPGEAIRAPRIHHQWFPDTLYLESKLATDKTLVQTLQAKGHRIGRRGPQGDANSIFLLNGPPTAVTDMRRGGLAAGLTNE